MDVIDLLCAGDMPHVIHGLVEFLKASIRAGRFHSFGGVIYSQKGIVRCEEGKSPGAEEIVTLGWLAENLKGGIPQPEVQRLMRLQRLKVGEALKAGGQ